MASGSISQGVTQQTPHNNTQPVHRRICSNRQAAQAEGYTCGPQHDTIGGPVAGYSQACQQQLNPTAAAPTICQPKKAASRGGRQDASCYVTPQNPRPQVMPAAQALS